MSEPDAVHVTEHASIRIVDPCGEGKIFWPDVEACEAVCGLGEGHDGPHEDPILGEWDESWDL